MPCRVAGKGCGCDIDVLSDIITYVRRIIKTPSTKQITDSLICDYINRFWIMDVDARIQVFDLKTTYSFQTAPNQDQYNMPLYVVQAPQPPTDTTIIQAPAISLLPVYQGFLQPVKINGINVPLYTTRTEFYDLWPNYVQNTVGNAIGNGTAGPYQIQLPFATGVSITPNPPPSGIKQGHIDITGIYDNFNPPTTPAGVYQDPPFVNTLNTNIRTTSLETGIYITFSDANGNNVVVTDSGQYFTSAGTNFANYGLLMTPGPAPFGNTALPGGYSLTSNTVNYQTGILNVTFPTAVPTGQNINTQVYFYETGLPRAVLFYNNVLTLRSPPDKQYLVELAAYLTPAAFLRSSQAIQFGYMCEYIARGAARKILTDVGDWDQFNAYEPLFIEQERLVWKRSQRQWTATRTETIYSNSGLGYGAAQNGMYGSGAT